MKAEIREVLDLIEHPEVGIDETDEKSGDNRRLARRFYVRGKVFGNEGKVREAEVMFERSWKAGGMRYMESMMAKRCLDLAHGCPIKGEWSFP